MKAENKVLLEAFRLYKWNDCYQLYWTEEMSIHPQTAVSMKFNTKKEALEFLNDHV